MDKKQRLTQLMEQLSAISEIESEGAQRLLYSDKWLEAQQTLRRTFETAGLQTHFDAVGNLFGKVEGSDAPEDTITSGSHIDTVIDGGRFDGQLGVICAFVAIEDLLTRYGQPKKSLQVLSLAEEEGSRFPYAFWGSKNLFGDAEPESVRELTDVNGVTFETAMTNAGFRFPTHAPSTADLSTFIELHIEQGNRLDREHYDVGIVNAIVGQKRFDITLTGQANHAGTTPMSYRRDTIACAAKIINTCLDEAVHTDPELVLTFGRIIPEPNTVNVIPGVTTLSMDCRHADPDILNHFVEKITQQIQHICDTREIRLDINQWMDERPTPLNTELQEVLTQSAKDLGFTYREMPSGAGHDSQIIAPHVPTAMLFVPSKDGISHAPEEFTDTDAIIKGLEVLERTLYHLAY